MRIWPTALLLLGLAAAALAQGHPSEATVARFPTGAGLVISSDGLVAVPAGLEKGGTATLDGARLKAAVVASKPGAPFALVRLAGGPFPTVGLGSTDLVHEGDNVLLWTAAGEKPVGVRTLSSDPVSNQRYLCLDLPYDDGLRGWPVLYKGEAVALITGAEPGRPGYSRAVSVQELKLFLFNQGVSLKGNPHPALATSPGGATQPGAPRVEEWSFPLRSGATQKTSELLALDTWRYSFGAQPALLAPLAVDGQGRLYLATFGGTVYCLDFDRRQMEWRTELDPGALVLSPPRPLPDGNVLVGSGQLGVLSVAYRRTGAPLIDLFQDISGRAQNSVSANAGDYYALAGDSGAELWKLPTRFPSPPPVPSRHASGERTRTDRRHRSEQWEVPLGARPAVAGQQGALALAAAVGGASGLRSPRAGAGSRWLRERPTAAHALGRRR